MEPDQAQQEPLQENPEIISGGLVIHADQHGYYRGTVIINQIAMPYLIDTGATVTVIPYNMTVKAQLPIGEIKAVSTANGLAQEMRTEADSIKLGNAEVRHIEASVNYTLDEVLIGMNLLKHFTLSVQNNTMTLASLDGGNGALMTSEAATTEQQGNKGQNMEKNACMQRYRLRTFATLKKVVYVIRHDNEAKIHRIPD